MSYQNDPHYLAGRMSHWHRDETAVVSYCTCGLAFYGMNREEADKQWRNHSEPYWNWDELSE